MKICKVHIWAPGRERGRSSCGRRCHFSVSSTLVFLPFFYIFCFLSQCFRVRDLDFSSSSVFSFSRMFNFHFPSLSIFLKHLTWIIKKFFWVETSSSLIKLYISTVVERYFMKCSRAHTQILGE